MSPQTVTGSMITRGVRRTLRPQAVRESWANGSADGWAGGALPARRSCGGPGAPPASPRCPSPPPARSRRGPRTCTPAHVSSQPGSHPGARRAVLACRTVGLSVWNRVHSRGPHAALARHTGEVSALSQPSTPAHGWQDQSRGRGWMCKLLLDTTRPDGHATR